VQVAAELAKRWSGEKKTGKKLISYARNRKNTFKSPMNIFHRKNGGKVSVCAGGKEETEENL